MKIRYRVTILAVIFSISVIGYHNDYAFGYHVDEHEIYFDDPLISIQDDKVNIIWEARNQNIDSAIIFTQLIDGKTTILYERIKEQTSTGLNIYCKFP